MSLMLLDTASLYFRAFFGLPDTLRSPDGKPVNAVRGLLDMIAFLVTEHRPDRLVACWDEDWRPAFRVEAIPSYKGHRVAQATPPGVPDVEEVPDALTPQIAVIVEVLAALGIARVGAPGHEADDVIGTLVARETSRPVPDGATRRVDIVTGDRDLFQLVDDAAGVRVLFPARGVRDPDVVDQAKLAEKYGLPTGAAYADMAILRGDPSDGLPGVPGIGEKTAVKLLTTFGDLDAIRAAAADGTPGLTPSQRARLREASDYLDVAPVVVQVARDAPVDEVDDALPRAPHDPEALDALAERWGIRSSVDRVLTALERRWS
ncbi:5'-3' exonuclease [Isoptericola variabilis]|uniref:5'-3' exonuclease n=1 Tax=Isoptericola variabilis (strain 225) TaxID=743718 RepID=F6FW43_ISOV2|nr:5'-3' exonuclease [Isoptericola variabilis]AEG45587.1 5'-3' exonuclease, resolvase-like domain-containing protein [Isoptericola variabilis 225]TWH25805.1 5'-3' exonuclease [Isoptericola variabilis J7]